MNWGVKIIFAYIGFAILVITLVTICMKQDVSLVAFDYYKQEIAYQDQIDRINNYSNLEQLPEISFDRQSQQLSINFSKGISVPIDEGQVHLFRPSDASLDRTFEIKLGSNGLQTLDLNLLTKGLWKIKLNWSQGDRQFYHEKILVI